MNRSHDTEFRAFEAAESGKPSGPPGPAGGFLSMAVALALLFSGCGTGGDISGGGNKPDADTLGLAPLDTALALDTLRVASLNMSIGFQVSHLLFTNMDVDTVAYDALQKMYGEYLKGYPADRVKAMAKEIVEESLDVVGLQEVMAIWKSGELKSDFLAELRAEIAALGGPQYAVFSTVLNDTSLSGKRGDSSITIKFQEGNAVLVRPGFAILDSSRHSFFTLLRFRLAAEVVSERSVDYLRLKSPKGTEFQVFNTHLEVVEQIRLSQSRELARLADSLQLKSERAGAMRGKLQIVLGDLNSEPQTQAHRILGESGFRDTFYGEGVSQDSGMTCCVSESVLWDAATPFTQRRIDFVMARGLVAPVLSRTRVKTVFTTAASQPFFASDHRMVVAHIAAQ